MFPTSTRFDGSAIKIDCTIGIIGRVVNGRDRRETRERGERQTRPGANLGADPTRPKSVYDQCALATS